MSYDRNHPATPLTSSSQFIQADVDDDDLDDGQIPGYTHPTLSPGLDKGKNRASYVPDQLATPSQAGRSSSPALSGNIGSGSSGAPQPARRMVGGVRVETRQAVAPCSSKLRIDLEYRYTGVDTLDEPVMTTIVRGNSENRYLA